ncbi:MAG: hypothetical protein IPL41_12510 [Micropruina sp.]|nr:hypothetical protein [Micropruina sp.]
MYLYAPPSAKLARQIALDVLVVAWCTGWWLLARVTDGLIRSLADYPRSSADTAREMQLRLREAADAAGQVPVAGSSLRSPLDSMAGTVGGLVAGSDELTGRLESLATGAGVALVALPLLMVVPGWLWHRVRFVLDSRAVAGLIAAGTDTEMLALRALARQPLRRLVTVSADPSGAWRDGDPAVIAQLAELERRQCGWPRPKPAATSPDAAIGDN